MTNPISVLLIIGAAGICVGGGLTFLSAGEVARAFTTTGAMTFVSLSITAALSFMAIWASTRSFGLYALCILLVMIGGFISLSCMQMLASNPEWLL